MVSMSDLTPKGFSDGQYVDRYLLRDKLYAEDAITMKGVAILNEFPAADVAPVRRGRWIKDGEDGPVYCSECGEEHEWGDYRATYCDTCGAKMDGGQGNV